MNQRLHIRCGRGFTLIESLVFLFIFGIVSLAFLQTFAQGTRLILESKKRLGATSLANQKMEIIRGMQYDAIGTTTGIPAGALAEYETVNVNTVSYQVHTFVQYLDDGFDGTSASSPPDTIPNDYKRVKIEVAWGLLGTEQTVSLVSTIAPKGVETSTGGGILSINILDSTGLGVEGMTVRIVNAAAGVDITAQTDTTGNITLPGAPVGTQNYALTASKTGYYGVLTYPPYPSSPFTPVDEHASVVADTLNQKSMIMDRSADLAIRTQDSFGASVPGFGFTLTGGKILGTDPLTGAVTYGYSQALTTDAAGLRTIDDQSYGTYTLVESDARYEFYKLVPESTTLAAFDALPGTTTSRNMLLLDTQIGSVKVVVTNATDTSPVAGATVRLSNATLMYDTTLTTDQYGFAYFPTTLPALAAGTYNLAVSATGFGGSAATVDVNGALVTRNVALAPN